KVVLTSNKLQSDLDKQVDALLRPFMQSQGSVGLSAAVIIGDKVYSYHYGESKINNKTLPQQQTIYEIGSITKTFTGSLLAIAVNEGKNLFGRRNQQVFAQRPAPTRLRGAAYSYQALGQSQFRLASYAQ
ncbi:MAG: serine hydrolase, partial [Saprospiraceae bacterium]|nr:serine hydrolase [Saprospiraceae bacterium]